MEQLKLETDLPFVMEEVARVYEEFHQRTGRKPTVVLVPQRLRPLLRSASVLRQPVAWDGDLAFEDLELRYYDGEFLEVR